MTMNPATKELIKANLKFCGSVALTFGVLGGFLAVMGLGGSVSGGAEFWGMGLLMTAAFAMLIFFPLFILSLNLQSVLICFRLGQQNNSSRMTLAAGLLLLTYILIAVNFLNLGGIVMLVISGLWSFRKVDAWFRLPFEKEKAKHGLEEKPKNGTGWQPSRVLIYALVSLFFACAAYIWVWGGI